MVIVKIDAIGKFKYTTDDLGKYHSFNDLPAIEYFDSEIKIWMDHGLIHREEQYAILFNKYLMEFYDKGELILRYENKQYLYNGKTPEWLSIIYFDLDKGWSKISQVVFHNNYYYYPVLPSSIKKIKSSMIYIIDTTFNSRELEKTENIPILDSVYKTIDGDIYITSNPNKIDMDKYYIIYESYLYELDFDENNVFYNFITSAFCERRMCACCVNDDIIKAYGGINSVIKASRTYSCFFDEVSIYYVFINNEEKTFENFRYLCRCENKLKKIHF